jgi:beta-xylosidase
MDGSVNPILTGSNPDPSIVRVEEDYFLVTSSFEYFPGAPIYHSSDLSHWNLIGHALNRTSQIQIRTPEPGGGVWATTIRYHKDTFYIVAASFDRYRPQEDDRVWPRGFYVKTQNIWDSESWSDPVYFDQVGFDQDVRNCLVRPCSMRYTDSTDSFSGMTMASFISLQHTGKLSAHLAPL